MSTKAAAIHSFLSSFGIPAYTAAGVPEDAQMPYITYSLVDGAWSDPETNMTIDVWYRGESEAKPNAKVSEISKSLGIGGASIRCDNGIIWIKRGSPFAQAVIDEDNTVKRRMINLSVEFLTSY